MDEYSSYSVLNFVQSQKKSPDICRFIFSATITISTDCILKIFARCTKETFANGATGLLLIYPGYIVHILESPEDEMFQICSYFVNAACMETSKCFPIHIKIEERFFDKWHARKVIDDCETTKINDEPNDNFDNARKIYCRLINDLYDFCDELRASRIVNRACFTDKLDALASNRDPRLPEVKTLRSILQCPWGDSLKKFVEDYCRGISSTDLEEIIWPFPTGHCPSMDILK